MRKKRRAIGAFLIIAALVVMQLPVGSAEAAASNAFLTEGSTIVSYLGSDKSVTVPNNITSIGSRAFENNLTMETLSLPKSLKRIKPYAFWGCNGLKEIQFGSGLKEVGDYSFTSCQGLQSVVIPNNIISIGIRAFADCVNLTSITIPESVQYIHETAFDGCTKLVITCPEGSYADKYARDFYKRQAKMEEYEDVPEENYVDDGEDTISVSTAEPDTGAVIQNESGNLLGTTSIVGNQAVLLLDSKVPTVYQGEIPRETQLEYPVKFRIVDGNTIADQAYYRDELLTDVILPDGIREVGEFAFARSKAESFYAQNGLEKISFGAFYHCDHLGTVILPDSVSKVEPQSFEHTKWMDSFLQDGTGGQGDYLITGGVLAAYRGAGEEVQIPEGVRVIAAECFKGHEEIRKCSFPESLTDIGEAAFEECGQLTDIVFPDSVKSIGDRAFAGCGLTQVELPGSLKSLGLGAFDPIAAVSFGGKMPGRSYESSAQRLSNESYRYAETDPEEGLKQGGSVLVVGYSGASAELSGAERPYSLNFALRTDPEGLRKASETFRDDTGKTLSGAALVYDLTLRDDSGIPITRLGKQMLSLRLPVPESFADTEVLVWQFDRNGQLEELEVQYQRSGEQLYVTFETGKVFGIVLESTGNPVSEELIREVERLPESAAPGARQTIEEPLQTSEITAIAILKWTAGAVMLLAGLFLALSKVR